MINTIRKIALALSIGVLGCMSVQAQYQQSSTLYFLENVPLRHTMNPAFQPISGFYIGITPLAYTHIGIGNNSFTLNSIDLLKTDQATFLKSVKPTTLLGSSLNLSLFDMGFRHKNRYWTFGVNLKNDIYHGIPKDFISFLMNGTPDINDNEFNFNSLSITENLYLETALGYSRILNDKWSMGVKLKGLVGLANASMYLDNLKLTANVDEWTFDANGTVNMSSPAQVDIPEALNDINVTTPSQVSDFLPPPGIGGGVDLGLTYKPIEKLTLAASVNDLGLIRWSRNVNNVSANFNYTFTGAGSFDLMEMMNGNITGNIADSILQSINDSLSYAVTNNSYITYLSPKVNLSAEYGVWDNRLSLGLLSSTQLYNKQLYEELTVAFNFRPLNWFNITTNYSITNGRGSNIGAGIGMRFGIWNVFTTVDYISLNNAPLPFEKIGLSTPDLSGIPVVENIPMPDHFDIPYKTDRFVFAFGVNTVLGNKQDRDKDGVKDRKDKCPKTPRGVKVDKKGCPLDTDGDKVADYLDSCANTPVAAYEYIDTKGCPIDTDGDGVFDYLDQCPNSIPEEYPFIGTNGCVKDTDEDGVLDNADKCPETPRGVVVDSVGCPLDTDKDGVADYIDKCPDTPVEAFTTIDQYGCPKDTDKDGVLDYLDQCPNTPVGAPVDSLGCPLDTDKDGVADYIDQCPGTPLEVRRLVNQFGCPLDSDNDSVPDYLDYCPSVPGVASNRGCPEVKKEVRTLLQKALQGIQFETGKDLIKASSNSILNQIAKLFVDNPSYRIEIQGHTDNVGKPEANLLLSQKRADAVRNYLIQKGIDPSRMTAVGYGDTKPVGDNKTTKGKAQNRRVEFIVSYEEVSFE